VTSREATVGFHLANGHFRRADRRAAATPPPPSCRTMKAVSEEQDADTASATLSTPTQ